ncbi:uncharacterized protein G2W53_039579 [Senna tora]|uniref:Uncharacterized protein n=1 Tax=Senna tora TaxID=362788 RepID=A0A834SQT8_9FABA|nr:uncharacterized protein G2W53_039579 [Senna tora]
MTTPSPKRHYQKIDASFKLTTPSPTRQPQRKKVHRSNCPHLAKEALSKNRIARFCILIESVFTMSGESPIAVMTGTSASVERASPFLGQDQSINEGRIPGVASHFSDEPEVAPNEHNGLDSVVVETPSTLTSMDDLRNIWELCFAPFEREILSTLKTCHSNSFFIECSFDFDFILAKPDECVLDGPFDSFAFYLYPMLKGGTQGHGKNKKRFIEPLSDALKNRKGDFFFVVSWEGCVPSWWFDSEGESLFPPKWIEPNSEIPRPKLGDCSDESLRTISALVNLGPPKKCAKREEARKGQISSIPSSEGTHKFSKIAPPAAKFSLLRFPRRSIHLLRILFALEKVKDKTFLQETILGDLTKPLPSPPSMISPGAEREIPLLDYNPAVHNRVGDRALAPVYPVHDDYLTIKPQEATNLKELNKLKLTLERDRLKLEKETIVASNELLKSKLTGSEQEAINLKEQNNLLTEKTEKLSEQNEKLSKELTYAIATRDKIARDAREYLESLSKSQEKIYSLGAKDSIYWAWNNCLDQVKLLNPSLPIVFEGIDVYSSVIDGKLVSTTTPEKEEDQKEVEEKENVEVEKIDSLTPKEIPPSLAHLFEEAAQDPLAGNVIQQTE